MPTSLNKYLDPAALDETVVNIRQLTEGLEEEMQDLPYARPDGLYPDMTVGAVIGADSTAQWATRESTGSGAATVRSVQGASVAWEQKLRLFARTVTSAGVTYTATADGKAAIEGTATANTNFTFYGGLPVSITEGHKYLAIGSDQSRGVALSFGAPIPNTYDGIVTAISTGNANPSLFVSSGFTGAYECYPQLFDLTAMFGAGNEPQSVAEFNAMFPASYYPYSEPTLKPVQIAGIASKDAQGGELDAIEWTAQTLRAAGSVADMLYSDHVDVKVGERAYQSGDESDATVRTDGTTTYYPLATPTTQPISPAFDMTYKVQAGGSESIIVPAGEISAAPVMTVAEPVNAGDEFARIWAAIESLGYTRNTAQLSRPVSLTDIGSIDEVQKDTADIVEIDTTKEVTE